MAVKFGLNLAPVRPSGGVCPQGERGRHIQGLACVELERVDACVLKNNFPIMK